jgi:hypothetical protein
MHNACDSSFASANNFPYAMPARNLISRMRNKNEGIETSQEAKNYHSLTALYMFV